MGAGWCQHCWVGGVSCHPSGKWLHAVLRSVSGVRGAHPWAQGLLPGACCGAAAGERLQTRWYMAPGIREQPTWSFGVEVTSSPSQFGCSQGLAWCLHTRCCLQPALRSSAHPSPPDPPSTHRPHSSSLSLANYDHGCKVQPGPGPENRCLPVRSGEGVHRVQRGRLHLLTQHSAGLPRPSLPSTR